MHFQTSAERVERPHSPDFTRIKAKLARRAAGEGMGLFESTHLLDQNSSTLCRGPSRGLHSHGLMVSPTFFSSRP